MTAALDARARWRDVCASVDVYPPPPRSLRAACFDALRGDGERADPARIALALEAAHRAKLPNQKRIACHALVVAVASATTSAAPLHPIVNELTAFAALQVLHDFFAAPKLDFAAMLRAFLAAEDPPLSDDAILVPDKTTVTTTTTRWENTALPLERRTPRVGAYAVALLTQ
jgi:hypothetical protein